MSLSLEQFKELRGKGLSIDQITRFDSGEAPARPTLEGPTLGQRALQLGKAAFDVIPRQINPLKQAIGLTQALQQEDKVQALKDLAIKPESDMDLAGREFASEFLFNAPKTLMPEAFPEPETEAGKLAVPLAKFGGMVSGLGPKLALKGAGHVLPKIAGEGMVKKIGRDAITGGLAAGSRLTPDEEGKVSLEQQAKQTALGTLGGAAFGTVAGGLSKAKAKIDASPFNPSFLTEQLAPKMEGMFKKAVERLDPKMQGFLNHKLKIPQRTIATIKSKGIDTIRKVREKFNDSTDDIFTKIEQGFVNKDAAATQAFNKTINRVSNKANFPIDNTIKRMEGMLTNLGLFKGGKLTPSGQQVSDPALKGLIGQYSKIINRVSENRIRIVGNMKKDDIWKQFDFSERLEMAKRLNTDVLTLLKMPKNRLIQSLDKNQILKLVGNKANTISKRDYQVLKLEVDSLFKESKSNRRFVQQTKEALFDDADQIAPGTKQAKELFRKNKEAEEKFRQSQFKEKKLDNYQKFSEDEIRQLKEVEEFTGVNFVDDVDSITAARMMDKVDDYTREELGGTSKLIQALKKADNAADFNKVKKQFEETLGKSPELDKLFKDLKSFTKTQDIKNIGLRPLFDALRIKGLTR